MFRWFSIASFLILSWQAGPAAAQPSTNFRGPTSGFVYSYSSRTIRPLLGVPGAAHIGSPLLNEVDYASVGPNGKWAFITRAGRSTFVHNLAEATTAEISADGLIDAVDRVLWNRAGSVALLYSSSGNRLQRVRLFLTGAEADAALDLSSWGSVTALAIDPPGRQIAFGVAGLGLYRFDTGQSPTLLSSIAKPAAAAFDGTGRRLYAVDLDRHQILEFDSDSSAMTFASLAQPEARSVNPVGLAVSGDGQYLVLADSEAHTVRVYDTTSRSLVDAIPLDFAPTRFEALSPGPTFLMNGENSGQWLLLLDASRFPRVSFVPANREEAQ